MNTSIRPRLNTCRFTAVAIGAVMALTSCSSEGPAAVRTGTPAYYFQNARDAYAKGDYQKTLDWLDKVTKASKNEFTGRAWTFRLLLESGLISGYKELADNYEYGKRSNKTNPTPFIKKLTEYRGIATRMTMPLGEQFAEYQKNGVESEAVIDFPFPASGSTAKPAQLNKIAQGIAPSDADSDAVLKGMLSRGVVLAICQAIGAKEDTAKGRAALQSLPVKVPRGAFDLVMANTLLTAAQLHGAKLSGSPAVQEFLSQQAMKAIASVPDTGKETKALKSDIEKELKDAKKRKG